MNPIQTATEALQRVPRQVRYALYALFTIAGLQVGACGVLEVHALFGLSVAKEAQVLGYLAPVFGVTAGANLTPTSTDDQDGMGAGTVDEGDDTVAEDVAVPDTTPTSGDGSLDAFAA